MSLYITELLKHAGHTDHITRTLLDTGTEIYLLEDAIKNADVYFMLLKEFYPNDFKRLKRGLINKCNHDLQSLRMEIVKYDDEYYLIKYSI